MNPVVSLHVAARSSFEKTDITLAILPKFFGADDSNVNSWRSTTG